jgi:hypothetical protein
VIPRSTPESVPLLLTRIAYDDPPNWYYPIRETLGGALLRAG